MTPPILLGSKGSETILSRNAAVSTPSLTASQAKVDGLVSEGTAFLTSYKSLGLVGGIGLAARAGLGSGVLVRGELALGELSAALRNVSLATRTVPGLGALAALISGCSDAPEGNPNPEIPDGSNPPPGTDQVCDDRRSAIQNADQKPAALQSIVNSITLPTIDFRITANGNTFTPFNDSNGVPVTQITPTASDIVGYQKIGDRLFVLTKNMVGSAYGPTTILVYKVNSDNTTTPVKTGSTIGDGNSNAIVIPGYFNPVAMAPMSANTELDVLFGAPNAGIVTTVDPYGLRMIESDWCSTHTALGDGGGRPDGGTSSVDSGTGAKDSGMDAAKDSGLDAGHDAMADAGKEAGIDSGLDGGPKDAGADG